MSVTIQSGSDSNLLGVDDNKACLVRVKDPHGNDVTKAHRQFLDTGYGQSTQEHAMLIAGKNDDLAMILRTDRKGNLITGNYNPQLHDAFEGATVNVQKWVAANTTFVPAQSSTGGYNFNNTNLTTANAVAILTSSRYFYKLPRVPLQFKARVRANIAANSTMDMGFGVPTTTTLMTPNGVSVRAVNGMWTVVFTYNGAEIASTNIVGVDGTTQFSTANTDTEYYAVDVIVDDDNAIVTVQNTATGQMVGYGSLPVPLTALRMWGATALPAYARVFNAASVPAIAPVFTLTDLQVLETDVNRSSDDSQLAARLHLSAGRNPFTGAALINHTNSAAPASATLSNTAAGYTTLGGKFQFLPLVSAEADYALFGFQVPANSTFFFEGIHIETMNTGAIVATTASVLEWAVGLNSTAVSLATGNIIRIPVGIQSFPVGAAIGAVANAIDLNLVTPEVVESGRFVHVIVKLPISTATASQIIRGMVTVKGRFF